MNRINVLDRLRRVCSLSAVLVVLVSFVVMRIVILPSAYDEVLKHSDCEATMSSHDLHGPGALKTLLSTCGTDTQDLYLRTELTAGVVNTVLLGSLFYVLTVFLSFRFG